MFTCDTVCLGREFLAIHNQITQAKTVYVQLMLKTFRGHVQQSALQLRVWYCLYSAAANTLATPSMTSLLKNHLWNFLEALYIAELKIWLD